MPRFAIVDRDLDGDEAVVMVVQDLAFAERISAGLRRRHIRADVVTQPAGGGPGWLQELAPHAST
jgi:hypothetical protein